MTYQEIRHRIPEGVPRKIKKQRPIGIKQALLFFLVMMILFAIFGSLIQYALGMVGVLITELFFLIGSILYVRWTGQRLKDVFPIRKPKLMSVFGTIVIWAGAYILMLVCDTIVMALDSDFPVNTDAEVITARGLNWFLLFFIVAVVPAICEEAMHRGVIQYGLKKKIKNPLLMAFIIGLIFGIFHLDPSKFLATAILGGAMGWILFRTDNMVYSSLFHFFHNASQMVLLLSTSLLTAFAGSPIIFAANTSQTDTASYMFAAGIMTIFPGMLVPILLYTGNYLLTKNLAPRKKPFLPKDKKERSGMINKLVLATLVFPVIGFWLMVAGFGMGLL